MHIKTHQNQLGKPSRRLTPAKQDRVPQSTNVTTVVEKLKKTSGTTRYVQKKFSKFNRYRQERNQSDMDRLVVNEILAGECYRFLDPKQSPKVRAIVESDTEQTQYFVGIISKMIPSLEPAYARIKREGNEQFNSLPKEEKEIVISKVKKIFDYGRSEKQTEHFATSYLFLNKCSADHIRQITRLMVSAFIIDDDDVHAGNWGFDDNSHVVKFDNENTWHPMLHMKYGVTHALKIIGNNFPDTISQFYKSGAFIHISYCLSPEMREIHCEEKYYTLTKALLLQGNMLELFSSTTIPDINHARAIVTAIQQQHNKDLLTLSEVLLSDDQYKNYLARYQDTWVARMKKELQEYNSEFMSKDGKEPRRNKKHRILEFRLVDDLFQTLQMSIQKNISKVETVPDTTLNHSSVTSKNINTFLVELDKTAALIASWAKNTYEENHPEEILTENDAKSYIAKKLLVKYKDHLENKKEFRALTVFPFFNYAKRTRSSKLNAIDAILKNGNFNDLNLIINTLRKNDIDKHSFWASKENESKTDGALLIRQLNKLHLGQPPERNEKITKLDRYRI